MGDNGHMATLPEKEAGLELDTTATHKVSKVKSTTLQELIGLGKDLGYSGKELQLFVAEHIARNAMTRTQRLLVTFYFFSVDRFV